MNRDEFVALRRTGIGGSDMGAVLGVSRWKTPASVWRQKRGTEVVQDNEAMQIGRMLEPFVLDLYEQRRGVVLVRTPQAIRHPEHTFLIGNLDARLPDRVVEAKTSFDARDWGEEGSPDIPVDYFLQVQHYMLLTGLTLADVPVFFRGERQNTFRIYEVQADPDLQAGMIEQAGRFWRDHVQADREPEPLTFAEMQERWTSVMASARESTICKATPELITAVGELRAVRSDIEALSTYAEELADTIKSAMGTADVLMHDGRPLLTWRLAKGRKGFDRERLAAEHPEIAARYEKTGDPYRVFLLK